MKTIVLPEKVNIDLKDWTKRTALESDFTTLIKEDVLIEDAQGNPLIAYLRPKIDFTALRETLQRVHYQKSERTGGLKTISRVFGYQPRIALRRDFCTATSLAYDDEPANSLLCNYGKLIDPVYRKLFPEKSTHHDTQTTKVLPEWRIPGTMFTSGIINKNNPLKYHFDAGNFNDVCSCMIGLRKDVIGGYLCLPELGMAFEIADGSLTIFDGQSLLHGVTPIKRLNPQSYRFTTVYYALKAMWKCEPLTDEVNRIRDLRTERERKRASKEIFQDQNGIIHEAEKE